MVHLEALKAMQQGCSLTHQSPAMTVNATASVAITMSPSPWMLGEIGLGRAQTAAPCTRARQVEAGDTLMIFRVDGRVDGSAVRGGARS